MRRGDYPGWRMVYVLAVTTTVNFGVLLYAFSVILPEMRRDLHASLGELSAAVSLAIAVSGVLAPVAGAWLDRHGARALMTVGSLLAMLSVAGWSQAHTLPELYAAFVGLGIASAAVLYDSAFAVVNTWFDRDRNSALLTVTVVAGLASTIFLPTTQVLIDAFGWRHALLVLAVLCGLTAVPHGIVLRRHPGDQGLRVDGRDAASGASPAPEVAHVHGWLRLREPMLRRALALPSVRWLTASTVAVTTGVTVVIVYLVSYLHSRGYTPTQAAVGAGAIGVLSVSGRVALTAAARRLRLARVAALMVSGQVVGVLLLMTVPRPWGLVLFVLSFGAGFGVMTIARAALLSRYVPGPVFARVSGVQAMVVDVGRVIAPVAAGWLIASTGYRSMLLAVMVCSAFAAWALVMADRRDSSELAHRLDPHDVAAAFGRRVSAYDVEPIDPHLRVHSVTGGVFRVRADEDSLVVKIVRQGVDDDPHDLWVSGANADHRNYWKREWLAFDSGLLDALPGRLRAPRRLLTTQTGDRESWIWMEDVRGRTGAALALDDYGTIARDIGTTQGAFAAGAIALPDQPWLSRDWLRGWVGACAQLTDALIPDDALLDERLAALRPLRGRVLALWERREQLLAIVDEAPRTLVHCDFWPSNIYAADDGSTVAVDWSQVGIGSVAQDLDQITLDTVWMQVRPEDSLDALESLIVPAYIDGLRAGGYDAAIEDVQRWYAAAAAAHYSWMAGMQVIRAAQPDEVAAHEARFGWSFERLVGNRARVIAHAVALGERVLGG